MADEYDVVVIGAGPAGEVLAGRCGDAGLSVLIVEKELVGGECSYWGCIPSKTLIRPGEVLAEARTVPGAAQAVTGVLDVPAALARRDEMAREDDTGQLPWLEQHHVELARGTGRLDGERAVTITAGDGAVRRVTARRAVVVATGTRAALPPVPGLAESAPWTNREVTQLTEVPRRLAVLGGGPIGLEMGQAVRRLGASEVTVVEVAPRLLAREEPFAGEEVRAALEAEGIRVLTGASLERVRRDLDGVTLTLADGTSVQADELLVAAGRRPATGDLGLDTVGLEPGRPLEVDDRLRVRAVPGEWLYAVGDANGISLLTHMGKYQARVAADVVLGKDVRDRNGRHVVPRVTFTDPQVAAVGLTLGQAQERYPGVAREISVPLNSVAAASTRGLGITGTAQLVAGPDDLLVGATFTGPGTAELVHAATIAIVGRVPLADLWHVVPSYPTLSEVWLKLLEADGR